MVYLAWTPQETLQKALTPFKEGGYVKNASIPMKNQSKVTKKTAYTPLTREQFTKAQAAGFSPEQIIEMEKRRKLDMTPDSERKLSDRTILPKNKEEVAWRLKEWLDIFKWYASIPYKLASWVAQGIKTAVTPWEQGIVGRTLWNLKEWTKEIIAREEAQWRTPATALKQLWTVARTGNRIVGDIFWTGVQQLPQNVQQDVWAVVEPVWNVIQWGLNLIPNQDVRDITEAWLNFLPLKAGKVNTKLAKKWVNLEKWALEMVRKDAESIALPSMKELGKRQRGIVAEDIIETKWFPFKKQELVRSPKEALAIEETTRLLQEGKLKKWMSEIQKREVVNAEVENLSKTLETNLRASNVSIPKAQVETLFDELSSTIIDNPSIVWEAESAINKLLPQLRKQLTKETYFPEDILQLRKDFDKAIAKAKWEGVFDPKLENAFSTAVRDFRQWLNNKVSELVPDAKVKQILDRQSALYTVEKTLSDRWAWQATSLAWQLLNKVQDITGIPRTEIIEFTTALWLWTVAAPFLAPLSATIWVWFWLKKLSELAMSSWNRARIGKILKKFDDAVAKNPSKKAEINNAKTKFINFAIYNLTKNGNNNTSDTGADNR